jgi:hypothetical protein
VNLLIQEIIAHRDFRTCPPADSRISQTPDFMISQVRGSGLHEFATSRLHRFMASDHRTFATFRLCKFFVHENIIHEFHELDVSRVTGFPEFPKTSPRGSGLTPTIRFHNNLRIPVKKRHPRNVGGDTRHPENSQRSNRGAFVKDRYGESERGE